MLPECFKQYAEIDSKLRKEKVVSISDIKERRRRRRVCQVFLQSQSKGGSA